MERVFHPLVLDRDAQFMPPQYLCERVYCACFDVSGNLKHSKVILGLGF